MGNILGLVVTYKWVFVGIAVFLILALIGAVADKKKSERFKFAEKNDEVNLTDDAKSAGETVDASATANNRNVGSDFSTDAAKTAVMQAPSAPELPAAAPAETASSEATPELKKTEEAKETPKEKTTSNA